MNKIEVYTDGACSGNPGKGGYAFVILYGEKEILKLSGCDEQTTNNRMELKAIVRSLQHVISEFREMKDVLVVIHSDSAYCINPVDKGWINFWSKNNWKTKSNEQIKNDDLWKQLYEILQTKKFKFEFVKVKGHSGIKHNEMVDKAAKSAILRLNAKSFPSGGTAK